MYCKVEKKTCKICTKKKRSITFVTSQGVIYLHVIKVNRNVSDLLDKLIVHLECPQLQASRQLCDGGEGEKELFGTAQGNIRVDQLSLLDPLLLLFCGDHCEDFLGEGEKNRRRRKVKEQAYWIIHQIKVFQCLSKIFA